MKLNVSPNPGWVQTTVGKSLTWHDKANAHANDEVVYTANWEPYSSKLGKTRFTYYNNTQTDGTVDLTLEVSYDGTSFVTAEAIGSQIANDTNPAAVSEVIDLSSYPGGLYRVKVETSADMSGITFEMYINEQDQ